MSSFFPLTSNQRDVWVDQTLHPDVPFYNIGGYLNVDGEINRNIFEKAMQRVVQENDALRIILHKGDPLPMQEIRQDAKFDLPFIDYSVEENPMQKAEAWMRKEFVKPFELYGQSLVRYALIKLSDQRYCCFTNQHHLIADGLSTLLMSHRFADAYNDIIKKSNRNSSFPSYQKFIHADQDFVRSKKFEKCQNFWKETYRDLPEPLIINGHVEAGGSASIEGGFSSLWIKRTQYQFLENFCEEHSVTPYHLLLAALYTCFLRAGRGEDFVYGAPVSNRTTAESKKIIGLFTSVSPMRFRFGLDMDTSELLQLISKELKRTYRYQRLPLSEINKLCGIYKENGRQLFDLTVSYEKNDYDMNFNGATAKAITYANGFQKNSLSIALKEYRKDEDIRLDFSYNIRIFDEEEIEYLKERVLFIMEDMALHPNVPVRKLELLPEREKRNILEIWNSTQKEISDELAHHLFEEQVKKDPEKTAAVYGDQRITYRQLNEQANQLSRHLSSRGVRPETLVGIFVERSIDMLIGILAVIKAGGAYVPLDPSYPEDRITFMLEDSGAKVVLTEEKLLSVLPKVSGESICLDRDQQAWSDLSTSNPLSEVGPDSLAYVIYTSGSTGKPKGVMIAHKSLCNLIKTQARILCVKPESRMLQFSSFSFDASVWEIFITLGSGATLILAPKEEIMPGPDLIQILNRHGVTHLTLPPSSLGVLPEDSLISLQTLVTAGESCSAELVKKWGRGRRFINAYGPTESTVCACTWEYDGSTGKPPIGRPFENVQLYILDDDLQPLPVGGIGELCIAGVGLAKGYLNRPDLTREKFISNPFSEDGARLYKTGDFARWGADGNIEFLGRMDQQVKLRGFRIELEEIESVLREYPLVQDAVVVMTGNGLHGKQLAAYFSETVKNNNADISAGLQAFLKEKLPVHMVPRFLISVKKFPYTPGGKLDRKALPEPDHNLKGKIDSIDPVNDIEKTLLKIWKQVVGEKEINVDDKFFDKGLDSLQAIEFICHMEEEFGIRIQPGTLFQKGTLKSLGSYIESKKLLGKVTSKTLVEIQIKDGLLPFFCVTAGYGDVLAFRELAGKMERSFYVLQPPPRNETVSALDIKNLAALYIANLRTVQETGPYCLGGYSAGGVLAFEMAQQLKAEGEKVHALVILGTPVTHGVFGQRVYRFLMKTIPLFLPKQSQNQSSMVRILRSLFMDKGLKIHLESLTGYKPASYPGKITIFEGRKASSRFYPWQKKWRRIAECLEIMLISGNHDSFIRSPNNKELAYSLESCLSKGMAYPDNEYTNS
jgi:amino acid adenylation domain-containing protein